MKKLLVDRWNETAIGSLRDQLAAGPCSSPFGRTEELLCDYRGVSITESLHKLAIEGVDFSKSIMDSGQMAAEFTRCRFRDCIYASNVGNSFVECDFSSAKLSRCVFRGKFIGCDFTSADLTHVRGVGLYFERCIFDKTDLRKASLVNSRFVSCEIKSCKFGSGSLAGSKFDNCSINDVDFDKTVMQRVVGIVGPG